MKNPSKRIGKTCLYMLSSIWRYGRISKNDLNPIKLKIPLLGFLDKTWIYVLLGLLSLATTAHAYNDGNRYAKNSVLAKGNWFKVKIPATGMYKITYDDLKKMGLSEPKNVQIYGYGGAMLDEDFSMPYIDDLPPISIWMSRSPENFGSGDYILFYGEGDIKWKYNSSIAEFQHSQHPYSSDTYYFVTESADGPHLTLTREAAPIGGYTVTDFTDYYLHEKELVNISQSGREFYGENFKLNNDQSFIVTLPGITTSPTIIRYEFIAKPNTKTARLGFNLNDKLIRTSIVPAVPSSDGYTAANTVNDYYSTTLSNDVNKLNFKYTEAMPIDKNVHLNFFRITYSRTLKPYAGVTLFRNTQLLSNLDFKITEASNNTLVFDVSNPISPVEVKGLLNGTNYSFSASNNSIKEYALIDPSKEIPSPILIGKIANQNLHASTSKEMVIIVHPYLKKYAEELAQVHKDDSNLSTLIVSPEDIYNEFSSGKPDATAYRRFMKMFHDRAANDSEKPRYLLLFGDGSFDNKLITNQWTKSEKRGMLLTYQSIKSLDETTTYVTDDYFGFLDDNEGKSIEKDKLDIGIGRLPIQTAQEAQIVLDKIKRYIRNEEPGVWQNTVTFIADDAVASKTSSISEREHMIDTDSYAVYLKKNKPEFILSKIYEDAYERVLMPDVSRWWYPEAKKAMLNKINSGTLVLNYVGHGSTKEWTHESLLTYPDIEAMSNKYKLPLWITATCDFSRFDASEMSGGEATLLNPNGGAIALFTTVRVVYASLNKKLSASLFTHLFDKEDGKRLRLGDIMRRTKILDNSIATDDNKLRFVLLGDPALRLSYPDDTYKVKVEKINDIDATQSKVQIQALANTSIKGRIVNSQGQTMTDFNGALETLIFDNEQDLVTRGHINSKQNGPLPEKHEIQLKYTDFINTIFSGKSTISNGEFEISFVTPQDILYSNGTGMMSFYAHTTDKIKNAQGVFKNYTVGGTSPEANQETNPPTINKIYLNDEAFKSGDKVGASPTFYAYVSDDTGINLASGVGHNISIVIDGKTSYDLTPTFVNDGISSKVGSVRYQIPTLNHGIHNLQFKVWDVWNNSKTQSFDFEVSLDNEASAYKFSLEETSVIDRAKFIFTCDPAKVVKIKYDVYSMNGVLEWSHETKGSSDLLSNYVYEWNLRGKKGSRVSSGAYNCRISININGEESTENHKLIILGQ